MGAEGVEPPPSACKADALNQLPFRFFCPITVLDFSPQSVTTTRLLPLSSFVRLVLGQNQLQSMLGISTKKETHRSESLFWWEQRESNPRPSACKADALNQLSYAPFSCFFCPITASDCASSVGHNHQVAPSFSACLPCSQTKQAAKYSEELFLRCGRDSNPRPPA